MRGRWLWALAAALPGAAQAHSFGRLYNLPVPLWLYLYGAAAALLLSFFIAGFFLRASAADTPPRSGDLSDARWLSALRRWRLPAALRTLSVGLLLLCIATGLFGSADPYRNFNMTFFWVVFMLGGAYLSALLGDFYAALNPWKTLVDWIGRRWPRYGQGRLRYPPALAYWPALALYMAFIWIELFTFNQPSSLARMLIVYSALNLLGVGLIGRRDWFRYCDFLSVYLRLWSLMAPLDYQPAAQAGAPGTLRWRLPFAGLLQARTEHASLLLFVLFMLSSTAFDGLRVTAPWFRLFWTDPFGVLTPWLGKPPVLAYVQLLPFYRGYETLCLLLSPWLYLAFYLLCIAFASVLIGRRQRWRELALVFALSLLPIALVYNLSHYFTLLLTQGVKIVSLLSDPFGWGWNLFGSADLWRAPILPPMGLVWHTQVGLIVAGHVLSVVLAHRQALQCFPTRRQAALSQLPMLLLMVGLTAAGLWILAQPLSRG